MPTPHDLLADMPCPFCPIVGVAPTFPHLCLACDTAFTDSICHIDADALGDAASRLMICKYYRQHGLSSPRNEGELTNKQRRLVIYLKLYRVYGERGGSRVEHPVYLYGHIANRYPNERIDNQIEQQRAAAGEDSDNGSNDSLGIN